MQRLLQNPFMKTAAEACRPPFPAQTVGFVDVPGLLDALQHLPVGAAAYALGGEQVEPNGSLGEAISYVLKRWERPTLFLRQPGAPLDNNICERLLKTSIRHRNNSLFYKSENGAHVGDLFMSLIHTCRLARANPFDYLITLRRYVHRLRDGPADWMTWNYLATAAALSGI